MEKQTGAGFVKSVSKQPDVFSYYFSEYHSTYSFPSESQIYLKSNLVFQGLCPRHAPTEFRVRTQAHVKGLKNALH